MPGSARGSQGAFDLQPGVGGVQALNKMWSDDADDDRVKRLPHLFQASDFLVVSDVLADLLRGFDLGASRLAPVMLLH